MMPGYDARTVYGDPEESAQPRDIAGYRPNCSFVEFLRLPSVHGEWTIDEDIEACSHWRKRHRANSPNLKVIEEIYEKERGDSRKRMQVYGYIVAAIERGADPTTTVSSKLDKGATLLHIAAAWGHWLLVKLLLAIGVPPNQEDGHRRTVFDYVYRRNQT
ncbi:hypothetical protein GQ43DRAFT_163574 [Delitschia confertaspora ATCC 74209]|uniref:Ankyrin repeat protein n=1 Tax=Delitschia confertaspora ATCC 74209 TaxID=1513339 RepID=A0A9P4MMK7_9PLEO|nr:hypothetical protein GQ43DRAFT_163574 [Delitschia confertaspora ATCC 74209]